MPALPPVPNVLRLSFQVTSPIVLNGSRIFFRYTGNPPGASTLTTFCGQVATAWGTNMAPVTHNTLSLTQVVAQDLNSATGSVGVDTSVHAGTAASTLVVPTNAATNVTWGITRHYRGGKPKTFFSPGREEDMQDSTRWSSAYITAFTTALTNWIQAIGSAPAISGGLQHVNVSYYEGFTSVQNPITHRYRNVPTLRTGGPLVDPIVALRVQQLFGSQRRRIPR